MSQVDISFAMGQMEKYGNIIIATGNRLTLPFVTEPAYAVNRFDRALGPVVAIQETDEQEFLKRAKEFGLGDVRSLYSPIYYYLAVAE